MRTANAKIRTVTQRRKLGTRVAPYFNSIAPRRLLGYIKNGGETVAGSWIVQVEIGRTETGQAQRRRKMLGMATTSPPRTGSMSCPTSRRSSGRRRAIPELGVEIRAHEMGELTAKISPHIEKLPRTAEPQRVNGHPWPESLPASKNLLPRR